MKIFLALYNPCMHESEFGVLSLHLTSEGAHAAVDRKKRRETKAHKNSLPMWVQFKVEEMKVLP